MKKKIKIKEKLRRQRKKQANIQKRDTYRDFSSNYYIYML